MDSGGQIYNEYLAMDSGGQISCINEYLAMDCKVL